MEHAAFISTTWTLLSNKEVAASVMYSLTISASDKEFL
jgi:hypothetical protein